MNEKIEENLTFELLNVKATVINKDDNRFGFSLPFKYVDSRSVVSDISSDYILSLKFKTKDENLLSGYSGANENTTFVWKHKLSENVKENILVTVEQCSLDILFERLEPLEKFETSSSDHLPTLSCRPKLSNVSKVFNDKKPTCLVNPMTNSSFSNADTLGRGFAGLENLGNTCYMNSVLQSLVNTREFRDYFLDVNFDSDLNKENPLGTGGDLAITFSKVCQKLWNAKFKSVDATFLKDVISKRSSQFYGYAQHDAQELMTFLVDGLHEDLNRVRSASKKVDVIEKDAEVVANSSWLNYKSKNDSIIVDLFQGQYKSKLVCPVCNKVSITFDPFLYLSVPLPKKVRMIPVVFFSLDYNQKPIKYYVRLSQDAKVEELKETISNKFNVAVLKLSVFEVYRSKIHRFIGKGQSLESLASSDIIFAFETYSELEVGEPIVEVTVVQRLLVPSHPKKCSFCNRERAIGATKLKRCTKCYKVCYCNESCQKSHWPVHRSNCKLVPELIASPFLITIPKSQCTYSKLSEIMEGYARYSVDIFKPPLDVQSTEHIQSTPPTKNEEELIPDFQNVPGFKFDQQQALFHITPVNQSGLTLPLPKGKNLEDKKGEILDVSLTPHLAMDWRNNERMKNYVLIEAKPLDTECFQTEAERNDALNNTTLDQCLNLFCASETLSPEEAWFCSKCQRNRQATKQMSIRRAPHTLIIQLKRFLFKNAIWREKIDKMIKYPIRGLDLTPYCCGLLPDEKPEPPPIYDLYAVIRHAGSIVSGHYTTTARLFAKDSNDTEIGWRLFDDRRVSLVSESEIVSRYAYVLFYRRRDFTSILYKNITATSSAMQKSTVVSNSGEVLLEKNEASLNDEHSSFINV